MHDLIFVSMEDWDEVWRRNQFLCAELVRRDPHLKILFVGVHRNVARFLRAGKARELFGNPTWAVPDLPGISVTRALRLAPERYGWGRRLNEGISRHHVRRVARQVGIRCPVLWLNPHYAVHMIGRMDEAAVVYDVTDDWTSLPQPAHLKQLVAAQDAALCRRADAVIVCSERLYEMKKPLAKRLYLIPNGVDCAHYATVGDRSLPLPPSVANWPRPVLGYTGSIHPDRVDLKLVADLAKALTHGAIALVGPDMLPPSARSDLERLGNVFFTGPVPYRDLPDYMRAFDVCITPHRVSAFTESLNPIKLWEYLAAGKPIVSTNVAGFRDYPHLVRIAEGPDQFLRAVQEALQENPSLSAQRQEIARAHSWESRLDQVEEVLKAVGCEAVRL